jgi:putative DNA primase/helicase
MVEHASSDVRIVVTSSDLDANPWLINCQNGTLDLEARELRNAERHDLITKITAVPYEPETVSAIARALTRLMYQIHANTKN